MVFWTSGGQEERSSSSRMRSDRIFLSFWGGAWKRGDAESMMKMNLDVLVISFPCSFPPSSLFEITVSLRSLQNVQSLPFFVPLLSPLRSISTFSSFFSFPFLSFCLFDWYHPCDISIPVEICRGPHLFCRIYSPPQPATERSVP